MKFPIVGKLPLQALGSLALIAFLTGCGLSSNGVNGGATSPQAASTTISGRVHGGQSPVVGSKIQLYAAGTSTTSYGGGATALIPTGSYSIGGAPGCVSNCTTLPQTDASGSFTITGDYTCPGTIGGTPSEVYLVASGGNPGSGTNANLALMAAVGLCAPGQTLLTSISASGTTPAINAIPTIIVNEVTTAQPSGPYSNSWPSPPLPPWARLPSERPTQPIPTASARRQAINPESSA